MEILFFSYHAYSSYKLCVKYVIIKFELRAGCFIYFIQSIHKKIARVLKRVQGDKLNIAVFFLVHCDAIRWDQLEN